MAADDRLIALGGIGRPHGLRGELRVHLHNPDSSLLLEVDRVWLRKDGVVRELVVESARRHGPLVLVALKGVRGRDAAESLRGWEICVPRAAFPPPDDDEVYHADLIGLRAEGLDGSPLGTVADVITYPSTTCLLVRSEAGEREVPLLPPYLERIDLDSGRVVLAHVEDFEVR